MSTNVPAPQHDPIDWSASLLQQQSNVRNQSVDSEAYEVLEVVNFPCLVQLQSFYDSHHLDFAVNERHCVNSLELI
jgi:hypothetical protein